MGRLINLPFAKNTELQWNEKIHTSSLKSKQIQPSAFGVGIGFVLTFGNRYGFFNLPFSNSLDFPIPAKNQSDFLSFNNLVKIGCKKGSYCVCPV